MSVALVEFLGILKTCTFKYAQYVATQKRSSAKKWPKIKVKILGRQIFEEVFEVPSVYFFNRYWRGNTTVQITKPHKAMC